MTESLKAGLGLAGFALWWFIAIVYMDIGGKRGKK